MRKGWRKRAVCHAASLVLWMLGAQAAFAQTIAQTDPTVRYQTWEGWGTSLCWWAHMVGGYTEDAAHSRLRDKLIRMAFGSDGLGLTVLRYNIGGGENPATPDSIELRARVPGYKTGPTADFDWTRDAAQRYVLQRAKALGANKFEVFSNSPPYWMTISGTVRGAPKGGNNLDPKYDDDFARYLVDVVRHFRMDWGITFETLAPMNEPSSGYWNADTNHKQEGCNVYGSRQSDLIEKVGAALAAVNLPTKVSAADETSTTQAYKGWDDLRQTARDYVLRINTHTYWAGTEQQVHDRAERDHKRLWMSEYGDGDASGMHLAARIVRDIKIMQPTAWCYWQVVDNGGGWGCVDLDMNNRRTDDKLNRKYYIYGQFTRFLKPGCVFLDCSDTNSIAALNGRGNTLVLVSVNRDDQPRDITHDLSKFARVSSSVQCYTSDQEHRNWQPSRSQATDKRFTFPLPPKSVTTFLVTVSP